MSRVRIGLACGVVTLVLLTGITLACSGMGSGSGSAGIVTGSATATPDDEAGDLSGQWRTDGEAKKRMRELREKFQEGKLSPTALCQQFAQAIAVSDLRSVAALTAVLHEQHLFCDPLGRPF